MQYNLVAVGALLLATAAAQPHGHHHKHAHARHAKRNVEIVTNIVDVTETVLLTATVWVDEQGHTISPVVTGAPVETRISKPKTAIKVDVVNEHTSIQPPIATTTPIPTPTPTPDTTTIQIQSVPTEAPIIPSIVEPIIPTPPVVVIPTSTVEVPTLSPQAPSGGSPSGECTPGSPCSGDITYYEAGLGACGVTNDGDIEHVVALPHGFMGLQSNGNPFCGMSVTISYNGVKVQAYVQDKCMGCVGRDLDLSNSAFDALGIPREVGRTKASWWFN